MKQPTAFVVFCGGGGASLGLQRAGFLLVGALDNDPIACASHGVLTGEPATCADVTTLQPADLLKMTDGETPDLVAITAPCQSYSACLPKSKRELEQYVALNDLAFRGLHLVLETWRRKPSVIWFENVPRMTRYGRAWLDLIIKTLQAYGYSVDERVRCLGLIGGLAQKRQRLLLLARHMEQVPCFIKLPPVQRLRGVGEVLGPLPLPLPPVSDAWLEQNGGRMHRLPKLSAKNSLRLREIGPGRDWKALPASIGLPYRKQRQNGPLGVNAWDEPAHTVVASATPKAWWASVADVRLGRKLYAGGITDGGNQPINLDDERPGHHVMVRPDGLWCRPLTDLELAVIQGMPSKVDGKWLQLAGSSKDRRRIIGNAIPVDAAEAIGKVIIEALDEARAGGWSLSGTGIWVQPERLAA